MGGDATETAGAFGAGIASQDESEVRLPGRSDDDGERARLSDMLRLAGGGGGGGVRADLLQTLIVDYISLALFSRIQLH